MAEHSSGGGRPERKSYKEKIAQLPDQQEQATKSNPLTETSVTSLQGLQALTGAYSIGSDGNLQADAAAPLCAPLLRLEDLHPLLPEQCEHRTVLALPGDVDPAELEALAVSVWDDACWVGGGDLKLSGEARLRGPWGVDAQVRGRLGLGPSTQQAWVLLCDPERGAAPTSELIRHDPLARAFPDGMPVGLELRVLAVLQRMARRFAGALAFPDSGQTIAPDPDSAVNLTVYSPRWLQPEDLIAVLTPEFPGVYDARDKPLEARPRLTPREVARLRTLKASIPDPPEDVRRRIAQERRRAMAEAQRVDGYAVVAPAGASSELMVNVLHPSTPPHPLRWEAWARSGVIAYQVVWLGAEEFEREPGAISRLERLERTRVARDIERAAGAVVAAVGGSALDEDGFLVALEDD